MEDSAPRADEMEISIFGPGKGEGLAVHVGGGTWITVDSCRDQRSARHPQLDYFERIGVDVASQVELVVATHAHDDHIAGVSELYRRAASAQFVASSALTSEEFFADVETDAAIERLLRRSARREYREVFEEAERRRLEARLLPVKRAAEQHALYTRPATAEMPGAQVLALSPSSFATERARQQIARGLAKEGDRKALSATDPNECAIALWVTFGETTVLLGADLIIGPEGAGWKAVELTHKPEVPASLFKVPHHGSPNAHLQATWDRLLTDNVLSLVAPFRAGRTPRPTDGDIQRIGDNSGAVYLTANSRVPASPRALRRAQASLAGVAVRVWDSEGSAGHVRARRREGDTGWNVEIDSPAIRVK